MLKVEKLRAGYGAINILWDLDFEINEGEIVAFLGSNGAGKTTTVRAVTGLIKPSAGSVNFNGTDLARKNSRTILDAGVVQVPEGRQLFTEMTVLENLEMGAFNKATREAFQKNLKTVYQWFPKLEERAQQAAGTLSGGEQQMVAVAEINAQGGVNGRMLEVVRGDHAGDPAQGRSEAERLITQEHVDVMMGCHMSTVTEVVAQVCTQYGVPMITAISTLDRLTDADHEDMDFFFRLCPLNSVYVEDMLKYLKDSAEQTGEEIKKIAIFTDRAAIGQVQDGEWKTVWPFDFTDTQILYPAPLQ